MAKDYVTKNEFKSFEGRLDERFANIDKKFSNIDKKLRTIINFFDKSWLNHEKRIKRVENHLGIAVDVN